MAPSSVVGNIVQLVKACNVRGTKAGQWAVLTKFSSESGLVDLSIFAEDKEDKARELAALSAWAFRWRADGSSQPRRWTAW